MEQQPEYVPTDRPEPIDCRVCGRSLTSPRSRELGVGPTCEKKPKHPQS